MWVFLLLGIEAIRTYKTNPYLVIGTHNIPTWVSPLVLVVVAKALMPNSSFFGHLSGVATGYLCKILLLSWQTSHKWLMIYCEYSRTRLSQIYCPTGEGITVDRRPSQPAGTVTALRQRGPKDVREVRRPAYEQPRQCGGLGGEHAETGTMIMKCNNINVLDW